MTNAIQGMPAIDPSRFERQIQGPSSSGSTSFLDTLKSSLNQAEQLQGEADQQVADLVTGKGGDVHSAMIAVEKSDLSFQMVMQVRNKIVAAYEEVSRMQF